MRPRRRSHRALDIAKLGNRACTTCGARVPSLPVQLLGSLRNHVFDHRERTRITTSSERSAGGDRRYNVHGTDAPLGCPRGDDLAAGGQDPLPLRHEPAEVKRNPGLVPQQNQVGQFTECAKVIPQVSARMRTAGRCRLHQSGVARPASGSCGGASAGPRPAKLEGETRRTIRSELAADVGSHRGGREGARAQSWRAEGGGRARLEAATVRVPVV